MIPSPVPKTPLRTPTSAGSKTVQLTPVWEEVVKNKRIPPEVNLGVVFQEISARLEDAEWPVRQHAFRVLSDIIPVLDKYSLDDRVLQNAILEKLVMNLGHPAPGVRKVASETIQQYLKHTMHAEKMLDKFVEYGVREEKTPCNRNFEISRENVTLGTIVSLGEVLRPFVFPANGGYVISPQCLNRVVDALCGKLIQPEFEEKAVDALLKIRYMVGEPKFHRAMAYVSVPPTSVMELLNSHCFKSPESISLEDSGIDLKPNTESPQAKDSSWSDETKSENSYEESADMKAQNDSDQSELGQPLDNSVTTYHNYGRTRKDRDLDWDLMPKVENLGESTDDASDGTDTDTYTKESGAEASAEAIKEDPSFIAVDHVEDPKDREEEPKPEVEVTVAEGCEKLTSPRVVLETELKFSTEKAIMMRILEDEGNSVDTEHEIELFETGSDEAGSEKRYVTEDGDLIMKILHDSEQAVYEADEDERKRTPRRVRFGGEVIKLRTPDSDATDITIEIQHVDNEDVTSKQSLMIEGQRPGTAHGRSSKAEISKPDKAAVPEQSHIPLPITPATVLPQVKSDRKRDLSPLKKSKKLTEVSSDGGGSLNSSSSSESELKQLLTEEQEKEMFWKWTNWGVVDEQCLQNLTDTTNWKTQYQALEKLKAVITSQKCLDKVTKSSDAPLLASLLRWLLCKMADSSNQQVATLSVATVAQLLLCLPQDRVQDHVAVLVEGLCRHVGGCRNLNLKMEAVHALKALLAPPHTSSVVDILIGDRCLGSSSSKMKENSLLVLMYATMTFPSSEFDVDKILARVTDTTVDSRRRVRHAALEAMAVLTQFSSAAALTLNVSRVANNLASVADRTAVISAVQDRLSRRALPTVSSEGLVLYALQIPASRRLGNTGSPSGADVDWILSGTGSVSTGSARSRCQLNTAHRMDVSPPTVFSPTTKWRSTENLPAVSHPVDNPWTLQKKRTEQSIGVHKTRSTGNLRRLQHLDTPPSAPPGFNPEEMTWALVPVSALDDQLPRRPNGVWADLGSDNSQIFSSSLPLGAIRPLYLKLQPDYDESSYSSAVSSSRKSSRHYGRHRDAESNLSDEKSPVLRVLTPSMLREKPTVAVAEASSSGVRQEAQHLKQRVPPADRNIGAESRARDAGHHRQKRSARQDWGSTDNLRKPFDYDDKSAVSMQRTILSNHVSSNNLTTPPAAVFLPNIHTRSQYGEDRTVNSHNATKTSSSSEFNEIDEVKLQDTMSQLSGLLSSSKALSKSLPAADGQNFRNTRNLYIESEVVTPIQNGGTRSSNFGSTGTLAADRQEKLFEYRHRKTGVETATVPVASAPAVITSSTREHLSVASSNSTDTLTSETKLSGPLEITSNVSYRSLNSSYNQKVKAKRALLAKRSQAGQNKNSDSGVHFPDNLKPYDRPKEGLDTMFNQLGSEQWEVNMLGLTSLIRLLRHHPALVLSQLHSIAVAMGRQIRNLRSQVARAACYAAAEMFTTLKKTLEPELDELVGPLFHRAADTNKFIRCDCNKALNDMTDSFTPGRVVSVIISKGTTHQNAVVRAASARLLLRLTEKVGPEKVLSLPKDVRDKMILAGANLLTEGRQETRSFAKQLFRVWSNHSAFPTLLLEATPPNVMRLISKTLVSLK